MKAELQEYYRRLIEAAKGDLQRKPDGSLNEEKLVEALAKRVPFDVETERRRKAKTIIDRAKRPGSTRKDGQLMLPGFNKPYGYEPDRLVSDETGDIIENSRVLPRFKSAQVSRAEVNVEDAVEQLRRISTENKHFQAWALEQALNGRPAFELTWGNCIAETGLHHPDVGEDAAE